MSTQSDRKASFKELLGWAMFDFANSSYTTVIITVVFGVTFSSLIVGPDADGTEYRRGNFLWSLSLAISYIIVFLLAPLIGAITDFGASKKRWLFYSYILTVVASALLYFAEPGVIWLAMIMLILSNIGFSSGENFVSSILPDLGPPESLGKISGYAWGLGYFGGLTSTAIVLAVIGDQTIANFDKVRLTGPITAAFFLLAGIPTFLWVKNRGTAHPLPAGENIISVGFSRLRQTAKDIRPFRDLLMFLAAVLFSQAGLAIIISFTFIYGDQVIKWETSVKNLTFATTQLTAAVGAILFGFLQDRIGAKLTFNLTLILWTTVIVLIYFVPELAALTGMQPQYFFLCVALLAGMGLGATQSSGRAIVGMLSPERKSGEFFGFWGLSTKLASVIGIFGLGLLQSLLGLKLAIMICSVFFVSAFVLSLLVNEKRGMQSARDYRE